ncbi:MAG: ABC transporter permease [Alphaproteobacteria bacterium]|nr:ABC transporter permease [Alphaproteobacteria bacterium]
MATSVESNSAGHVEATPPWRDVLSDYARSPSAVGAALILALILAAAVLAPLIAPQDPYDLTQLSVMDSTLPPGTQGSAGFTFWLGTDAQGRDMFSAILYGLRISLGVAITSAFFALCVGTAVGLVAAYFGGHVDTIIMRIVDLQLSFPAILIALMLLAILGQGTEKIILALVIVQWAYYARTVRGNALVERTREYVEAARCLALSHTRIVFGHILRNILSPLIVVGTVQSASAIALEATLSFLGLGLPITEPSLGLLIANGFDYMLSGRYWISLFPGIALIVTIYAINLAGDRMRDVLNPRLTK